jgi:DNA-binding response OmpR family regulator
LGGLRILIVEDEPLIAMELKAALTDHGAEVLRPTRRLNDSLELARNSRISAALLDVRLGSESVAPLAELLDHRGVPFAFYTGQIDSDPVCRRWPKAPVVAKPASAGRLATVLVALCGQ